MAYDIEIRLASKNGWHTPDEARAYYGRYDRNGVTIHWWNTSEAANQQGLTHDGIVNNFLSRAQAGTGSVNYVLSENKITMLVNPDNVAWTSQGGNPTTVSIEHDPRIGGEGYKKSGWVVNELQGRYGRTLQLFPHNYWIQTQCPGHISLDRIRQEQVKWANGSYNPAPVPQPTPAPTPAPTPTTATITWKKWDEGVITYVVNKDTHLWRFDSTTFQMVSVKPMKKGELFVVYGHGHNNTLKRDYYVTEYSFNRKIANGMHPADLDVYVAPLPPDVPVPTPPADPTPAPVPDKPEWEKNLRDIDDTTYWFTKEQPLIDIKTGKPFVDKEGRTPVFEKDDEFVSSALTWANGVEYRITDYSFKRGIFNGVPIGSINLTPPTEPDVPVVPDNPTLEQKVNWLMGAVQWILNWIKSRS